MFEGLLQPTHLILILVILLIVLGPGRLPEIGGALGKSIREFKRSTTDAFETHTAPGGIGSGPEIASKAVDAEPQNTSRPAGVEGQAASARNVCDACHALNSPANKYCGQCGAKLG